MCGIAGSIIFNSSSSESSFGSLFEDSLKHRGPDSQATRTLVHGSAVCSLTNTRLSIIDPENGVQPFTNSASNNCLVYNGEIFNFIELHKQLKANGVGLTSQSDTEVLFHGLSSYGLSWVSRLNGMFAFAFYDEASEKVFLVRDRLGIKPLFYFESPTSPNLFFASEIKSFVNLPEFEACLDPQSLVQFLFFNFVPLPNTLFRGVRHVPPGSILEIDLRSGQKKLFSYWELPTHSEPKSSPISVLQSEFFELFEDSIRLRLRSDVPIGTFLSGGLDSSMVSGLASQLTKERLQSYTVGFHESSYDESHVAQRVARLFDLENDVIFLPDTSFRSWGDVIWYNDQPHGDISFLPLYFLCRRASEDLRVVLTGDGGDELFGGYSKYLTLLGAGPDSSAYIGNLTLFDSQDLVKLLLPSFVKTISIDEPLEFYFSIIAKASNHDQINKALYFDTLQLLPGNNLVKPDRMGMANSLELRSPFLDYRLVEWAFGIPGISKLDGGELKGLLKRFALTLLPTDLVYRKKQMLTVPVGDWFQSSLSGALRELLYDDKTRERGFFSPQVVTDLVEDHIAGRFNHTRKLRALVSLELWFRRFFDGE